MKDTINEGGLPYITHHFIVLHPFLRRPQILLTFISHLDLTKKISLRSSNNSILFSAYQLQLVFKYVDFETFYLLLKYCLVYFVLYLPDVTCG